MSFPHTSLTCLIFCNIYICFQQLFYFYGIKWISQNFMECIYKGMTSNGLTFDYFLGTNQVQDQKPSKRDEPGTMDSKTLLLFYFYSLYFSVKTLSFIFHLLMNTASIIIFKSEFYNYYLLWVSGFCWLFLFPCMLG